MHLVSVDIKISTPRQKNRRQSSKKSTGKRPNRIFPPLVGNKTATTCTPNSRCGRTFSAVRFAVSIENADQTQCVRSY